MVVPVSFSAWVYETLEAVFLAFYMMECVLKLISFGLEYFKSLWNILGENIHFVLLFKASLWIYFMLNASDNFITGVRKYIIHDIFFENKSYYLTQFCLI